MKQIRAYSTIEIKSFDNDARILEGVASTPTTDRQGDIVEPKGAIFELPIPLLWMHDSTQPVGQVTEAKVTAAGIRIKAKIFKTDTPGRLQDRLDEAWESVKIGLVRGLSIGFKSIEYAWIDDSSYARRFIKWLWLELSAVTIPANAEANITAIKQYDLAQRAADGTARGDRSINPPAAVGVRSTKDAMSNNQPISERLTSALAELKTKTDRLETLEDLEAADGSLEANDVAERDRLTGEVKTLAGRVDRLKTVELSQAQQAPSIIYRASDEDVRRINNPNPRIEVVPKTVPPGIELARYIICRGAAILSGASPLEIAKSRYADTPRVAMLIKEAIAGASTQDATNAAPLVYATNLVSEFIEYLRPQTIIGRVMGMTMVPFNVSITGQTSGGSGYWVGEGRAKPLTSFNYNRVNLTWAKVAAISVILDELVRFSSPSAEALVRDGLVRALRERLDIDFIDPSKTAEANVSPASITNGITPLVSHGSDLDAVDADVQAMFNVFINAKITPTTGAWIMPNTVALSLSMMRNSQGNRAFPEITMNGGTFYGLPVIASQYCVFGTPSRNVVILVNAEDIFMADDGGFQVDVSREASLEMDDAPTMSAGALGSPAGAVGSSVVSMFQTNSMAIRAERYINWQRRRDAGVAYTDDVNWSPGGASV